MLWRAERFGWDSGPDQAPVQESRAIRLVARKRARRRTARRAQVRSSGRQ